MAKLRWLAITLAPPLLYLAALYVATRPPKPVYTFAGPTVMTVSDLGGPPILHAPEVIYPPQALRDGVEGSVTLKVAIAADGTVERAVPIDGPEPLRRAAADNVRCWQFAAKAQQTTIEVAFSLRYITRSLSPPEPLSRTLPAYKGGLRASVRVVAMVDPQGRVEFVHPITGPENLMPAAAAAVRQWTFRPALRNGKPRHATAVVEVPFGF